MQHTGTNGRATHTETQHLGLSDRSASELRHEVRNLLNAIKLSCAVLHRRPGTDRDAKESLRDIEQSADGINHLITEFSSRLK